MEQYLNFIAPNKHDGRIAINNYVLKDMLEEVIEQQPSKGRMFYINSVYSRFIDNNKRIEHEIRTAVYFDLVAGYLILLLERYGKH